MSERPPQSASEWHVQNEDYLSAALEWLRLKLLQQIDAIASPSPAPSELRLFKRTPTTASPSTSSQALKNATAKLTKAAQIDPPPALLQLQQLFNLSDFEQFVLLLCAAVELDTSMSNLCGRAQDDPARAYPTFALALTLFDQPTWDAISAEQALRYWKLIHLTPLNTQPLTTSPLKIDEHIVDYLKGAGALDSRLTPFFVPLEVPDQPLPLPPSQSKAVATISAHLSSQTQQTPLIQLIGPDSLSKQIVAQRVANSFGLYLYRLPVELLPAQPNELETLIRLWQRESRLMPIVLYLDVHHADDPQHIGIASAFHRFLLKTPPLCFLSLRDVYHRLQGTSLAVDIDKPTKDEQQALWASLVGQQLPDLPPRLSDQFSLNVASIQRIAHAFSNDQATEPTTEQQIWQACLDSTRPHLDLLAQRLDAKATWDDIVLPPEETALLHQIADQVRQRSRVYRDWGFQRRMNRGLGVSTLFAGESGTGKTMAAEVIANDLQLNLYRIDLSAVVSKYIGETEKNLRRLFDAAEDGGAILFFDEADALFGKRSEVKDSHDRYANIEINYLLQRIEAYRGLAILATNLKQALDVAFLRRLRFVVNFTFPSQKERQTIWQKAFPPEAPLGDIDYKRLAQFNLTGGNIHNIVLNAAFLAAQAGSEVTMLFMLAATRSEFRKLERPINEADFRE
ncbi:MAG: ATP-binding protein [Phormidesmis sp.]